MKKDLIIISLLLVTIVVLSGCCCYTVDESSSSSAGGSSDGDLSVSIPSEPKYTVAECSRLCYEVGTYPSGSSNPSLLKSSCSSACGSLPSLKNKIDAYYESAQLINDIESGVYDTELASCSQNLAEEEYYTTLRYDLEKTGSPEITKNDSNKFINECKRDFVDAGSEKITDTVQTTERDAAMAKTFYDRLVECMDIKLITFQHLHLENVDESGALPDKEIYRNEAYDNCDGGVGSTIENDDEYWETKVIPDMIAERDKWIANYEALY